MVEIKNVTLDSGDRKVISLTGGGSLRRKLPTMAWERNVSVFEALGYTGYNLDNGCPTATYREVRATFTTPHAAQVGDYFTAYTSSADAYEKDAFKLFPLADASGVNETRIGRVVAIEDEYTLRFSHSACPTVTQAPTVANANTKVIFFRNRRLRIGVRYALVQPGTNDLTLRNGTAYTAKSDWDGNLAFLGFGVGSTPIYSDTTGMFTGIDVLNRFWNSYYSNNPTNISPLTWREPTNAYNNGWYTGTTNYYRGVFNPAMVHGYGTYTQSVQATAPAITTSLDDSYMPNGTTAVYGNGLIAANTSDRAPAAFCELVVAGAGPSLEVFMVSFHTLHAYDYAGNGSGLTEEEFRECLHSSDLSCWWSADATQRIVCNGYYAVNVDDNTFLNAPKFHSAYSGSTWVGILDHMEFAWFRSDFECLVYDYGWSIA